jgi:hypothetical protein
MLKPPFSSSIDASSPHTLPTWRVESTRAPAAVKRVARTPAALQITYKLVWCYNSQLTTHPANSLLAHGQRKGANGVKHGRNRQRLI